MVTINDVSSNNKNNNNMQGLNVTWVGFVAGGALVGCVMGAITGQTLETGFLHGAGIGALSGAVVAIELLASLVDGRFNSKVPMQNPHVAWAYLIIAMSLLHTWPSTQTCHIEFIVNNHTIFKETSHTRKISSFEIHLHAVLWLHLILWINDPQVALFYSLVINGEVFKELVGSAMLKAYQWQVSNN